MIRKLLIVSILMLMLVVGMGTASAQGDIDTVIYTVPLGNTGWVVNGYTLPGGVQNTFPGDEVDRMELVNPAGERVCRINNANGFGRPTGEYIFVDGSPIFEVIGPRENRNPERFSDRRWFSDQGNFCLGRGINVGNPNYEVYFDTQPRRIYLYAAGSEVVRGNWLSRTNGSGEFGNVLNLFSVNEFVYLVVDHGNKGCILEKYDPHNPFRISVVDNNFNSTLCNVDAITEQERNLEGEGS